MPVFQIAFMLQSIHAEDIYSCDIVLNQALIVRCIKAEQRLGTCLDFVSGNELPFRLVVQYTNTVSGQPVGMAQCSCICTSPSGSVTLMYTGIVRQSSPA